MNLQGSIVLVTGASRGIGRALVPAFLSAGASRVYAAARNPSAVADLASSHPGKVVPLALDVTDPKSIATAKERAPDVTLLVNNAGLLASFSVLDSPRDAIERDFQTNFYGVLDTVKAWLPALERSKGAVANVLTVVSLASMPALGGYSATKAAAFSLTQSLRGDLAKKGVAMHAIFPGPVDTEMVKDFTIEKTKPEVVAKAIVDGIARGEEDIFPDPMSSQVFAKWKSDPKGVERMFASMV